MDVHLAVFILANSSCKVRRARQTRARSSQHQLIISPVAAAVLPAIVAPATTRTSLDLAKTSVAGSSRDMQQ